MMVEGAAHNGAGRRARGAEGNGRRPVAVVTGATQGLGLSLAHQFAGSGHSLVLVARTGPALDEVADALVERYSVVIHTQAADLTTAQGRQSVADAIEKAGLEVDYLVNNAAAGQSGFFHEADRAQLTELVDLNVAALTNLTRRYLPGMIERGRGGVLNVASLAGFVPGPYQAVYYATKAYVMSLTEALAHEVSGSGVKIAVLAPGPVATGFHERIGCEHSFYIRFLGALSPETVARIGYTKFLRGHTVIVPGWTNMISALALRLAPHFGSVPFVAWLGKQREAPGDDEARV